MDHDFDQSLDAHSEFIPIKGKQTELGESLVATSQKIYFQNASSINRAELQKDKKHLPEVKEQTEEESANQFLEVSKWKKAKDSHLSKDLENVKEQVDQIITKTMWKKKEEPHSSEDVIADQSIVPPEQDQNDEIEDQTQNQDQKQEEEQEQEQEEESEEEEEEQESEESEEEEEQEESEESEEEQEQEQNEEEEEQKQEQLPIKSPQTVHSSRQSPKPVSEKQKVEISQVSEDDKTDTRSEMKQTEYLPTKWSKKGSTIHNEDPWQRKEAILLRIAKLVS